MFEICNGKTCFLAETTAKNKTIEITLVKDSHGSFLNEHEIKLDLCRAILELQRDGYIVTKVRALDYDIENVVDVFHLPEFEEARCPILYPALSPRTLIPVHRSICRAR